MLTGNSQATVQPHQATKAATPDTPGHVRVPEGCGVTVSPDMDLLSEEGVQEVRRPLYRVSIKLLCLQERLHMKVVSLRHVWAVFCSVGGAHLQPDARLNRQEVTRILSRMFQQVDQEVKVDQEAVEEICSLTFRMFDGCVHKGASVWLSSCCPLLPPASPLLPSAAPAGPLLVRCCPLLVLAGPLLPSLPYAALWRGSGGVSAASLKTLLIVLSGDSLQDKYTALVGVAQEGAWSSGERGSISRSGLESLLRDLSQVPVAVQELGVASCSVEAAVTSCFHQVFTSSEAVVPPGELPDSESQAAATSTTTSVATAARPAPSLALGDDVQVSLAGQSQSSLTFAAPQGTNLLAEVRDLQRDKWLLEQQLQAWRLSVQSEQSILEKRCSGVEGTLEVLRRETGWLEGLLTQALNKAAEKHIEEEEEQQEDDEDENEEEEVIQDRHCEEEVEPEAPGQEEAWPQEVDLLLPHAEEQEKEEEQKEQEGVGVSVSVEQRLQQAVVQLKMEMEVEMGDRWSCSAGTRKGAELVEAAGWIGASIHHLVEAVRTTTSD
ncbi:dystrotelin [Nelusetta ayraudi]|uniref:dystrotelin n=1 Tax=Nelusetta ayraudi TaxID=303726 RepID=UPI003F70C21C